MKRSLISIVILCFFFFISSYFSVFLSLEDLFTSLSTVFIVVFALPLLHSLITWLGWKKGVGLVIALGGISLIVEILAIITGVPYGDFQYSGALGLRFLNVPVIVSIAYLPILFGSFALGNHLLSAPTRLKHTFLSALINTTIDLVIDPAAVKAHFWFWPTGGIYYDVPLLNFVGWLCTGLLYSQILYSLLKTDLKKMKTPLNLLYSLLLLLSFWTGYVFWKQLAIPVLIGCILLALLIFSLFRANTEFTTLIP